MDMIDTDIKQITDIIEKISIDICECTNDDENVFLEVRSDGFCTYIIFCNIYIWNSEDDEREWEDEEAGVYEDMEIFLRRTIMREVDKIKKIKIVMHQ